MNTTLILYAQKPINQTLVSLSHFPHAKILGINHSKVFLGLSQLAYDRHRYATRHEPVPNRYSRGCSRLNHSLPLWHQTRR
ncbi:hypothetical protein Hanom_Chr15g01341501 [Helianthus anomalus]